MNLCLGLCVAEPPSCITCLATDRCQSHDRCWCCRRIMASGLRSTPEAAEQGQGLGPVQGRGRCRARPHGGDRRARYWTSTAPPLEQTALVGAADWKEAQAEEEAGEAGGRGYRRPAPHAPSAAQACCQPCMAPLEAPRRGPGAAQGHTTRTRARRHLPGQRRPRRCGARRRQRRRKRLFQGTPTPAAAAKGAPGRLPAAAAAGVAWCRGHRRLA